MPVLSRVRTKLSDLAAALDALASRLAHVTTNVFVWPLIYAVTIGSGIFVVRHLSWVPTLDGNKVPLGDSVKMTIWVGVALVTLGILYGVSAIVARAIAERRGLPAPTGGRVMAEAHRRMRFLLMLPILPALTVPNIEHESPKETFFLITLATVITVAGTYAWLRPPAPFGPVVETADGDAPPPPKKEGLARFAAGFAIVALWAGYGAFFSYLAIVNHHALNTRTTDLGYYDNIFWQSAHGHPLACSFIKAGYHGSAHFDPILVVLSPLYLLYPRAEFLLVLQSVWLGAGVVPVYLLARLKLKSRLAAVALAAMYAIYPALHGANMYEFHSLTLLTPMALWLLYFFEKGSYTSYFVLLGPTLLVREDVSILMCFVGTYAILSKRPRAARLGWITIIVSLVYFAIVKRVFMVSADIFNSGGKDSYSFAYYYDDLIPNHNGVAGMLVSLVTNPVFVVKTMLAESKILYLITLFLPLVFAPFFAKPGRVLLVWGLLFCMLASRSAVYSVHFQYSSLLIPVVFALAPAGFLRIESSDVVRNAGLDGTRLRHALLAGAFLASLLVSWKFGGIVDNQTFKGGFMRVARGLSDKDRETYAWVREQADAIPNNANVGATNRTGAHISNRRGAYFYPEHPRVEWLFIDEAELHGGDLEKHTKNVQSGAFVLVAKHDRLSVYKAATKK